jgi:hypothetical protein
LNHRLFVTTAAAAIMLAGCGGSQPPIGAPGAIAQSSSIVSNHTITSDSVEAAPSSYHLLYSFGGRPDGGFPETALIDVNGILYGMATLASFCTPPLAKIEPLRKLSGASLERVFVTIQTPPEGGPRRDDFDGTLGGHSAALRSRS